MALAGDTEKPTQGRETLKARHDAYRAAAKKRGTVRDHVMVSDFPDGAFVEVMVWIPLEEIEEALT